MMIMMRARKIYLLACGKLCMLILHGTLTRSFFIFDDLHGQGNEIRKCLYSNFQVFLGWASLGANKNVSSHSNFA